MLQDLQVSGVKFRHYWIHQGFPLICDITAEEGRMIWDVFLPTWARFVPGAHQHHHASVAIICGRGHFFFGEVVRPYRSGDVFFVPLGVTHGFVEVDEETVFRKQVFLARRAT